MQKMLCVVLYLWLWVANCQPRNLPQWQQCVHSILEDIVDDADDYSWAGFDLFCKDDMVCSRKGKTMGGNLNINIDLDIH